MKYDTTLIFLLGTILLSGCSTASSSSKTKTKGVESLYRVQLKVRATGPTRPAASGSNDSETPEALQHLAAAILGEHLPRLAIQESAKWILEINLRWQYESLPLTFSRAPKRWCVCDLRVVRPVVIEGRSVEAVSYDSRSGTAPAGAAAGNLRALPNPGNFSQALSREVMKFVRKWLEENP